jgi:hypothetical protein
MGYRRFLLALVLALACAPGERGFAQSGAAAGLTVDQAKSNTLTPEERDQARKLFETAFGLLQTGDVKAATLGFERGLVIDPANIDANFYMAEALVRLGDNERARIFYNKVITIDPNAAAALKAQAALASLPTLTAPIATNVPPDADPRSFQDDTVVKGPVIGGNGGDGFDDTGANADRAPVTGIKVVTNLNPADHRQAVIGSLQVQWGNNAGPMHGGRGPLAQPASPVQFAGGEVIKKVTIASMTYNYPANPQPVWVAGVRILTSKTTYTFGNMNFGSSVECAVPDGKVLIGFYGRSGSYIDQLGCLMSDKKS